MRRFFDTETPIYQWLQKMATVIFCGFFWLICCIPVITAGASTTAMFREMFNLREGKSAGIRDFFRVFKNEFGKSTLLLLLQLLTAALLALLFLWLGSTGLEGIPQLIAVAFCVLLALGWLLAFSFVYPLTAYFDNTVMKTILNGLLMGIGNRFQSIPILALTMLPALVAVCSLSLSYELFYYVILCILPIWFFVIIPFIVYVQSGLYLKVFENYIEPAAVSTVQQETADQDGAGRIQDER